jgi:putative heme-binding domain-containing protein
VQTPDGVDALVQSVSTGKASPRLLTRPAIAAGLKNHGSPVLQKQAGLLIEHLPPASAEIDQRIATHVKSYPAATLNLEAGRGVFTRSCSVCHRMGNAGQLIGPQLDGIGQRGLERVLEDILDPNRNVDVAHRLSVFTLQDGRVISGRELKREGNVIVVIDFLGNEVRFAADEVVQTEQSEMSLMPPALGESLPETALYNLVGWLLKQ